MELFSPKLEFRHLLVGNSEALRIDIVVDLAFHGQAVRRGGRGDEVDNDLVADEWLATPVLADKGEQTVFYLVPLAGTWREVADRDFNPVSSASCCSFHFHSRTREPLLPPESAVINRRVAFG